MSAEPSGIDLARQFLVADREAAKEDGATRTKTEAAYRHCRTPRRS
ncbi:hypothetical protein [Streptomyces sp. SID8352]|nr:hypothetical protein [Streptomyces sp. SID8352]MYU26207.1 hypothetical protein [Streptomyces sp. SID8352]